MNVQRSRAQVLAECPTRHASSARGREAGNHAGRHRRLLLHQRRRRGQRDAIKLARAATGRHKILAQLPPYHGATAGSMMLPATAPLGGRARYARRRPRPRSYHGIARGWDSAEESLAMVEEVIQLEGPHTSPPSSSRRSTGTNGILVPPDGYMQGVRGCAPNTASDESATR